MSAREHEDNMHLMAAANQLPVLERPVPLEDAQRPLDDHQERAQQDEEAIMELPRQRS